MRQTCLFVLTLLRLESVDVDSGWGRLTPVVSWPAVGSGAALAFSATTVALSGWASDAGPEAALDSQDAAPAVADAEAPPLAVVWQSF